MPNSGPGGTKPPQLQIPPRITRAQPNVSPSVSNPNPVKHVSHQFDPFGGLISGAKKLGSTIVHGASAAAHKAEDAIFGNAQERHAADTYLHDKLNSTGPKKVILKKGWDSKAHFDKDGNPVGNWIYNQDNSGGIAANNTENRNGFDEHGVKRDPSEMIKYKGNTWYPEDFQQERDANGKLEIGKDGKPEWDDWIPGNTHHPAIYGMTNPQTGANIQYQLGGQVAVGGSGSAVPAGTVGITGGAAITGRANGSLTGNSASYGAASGGFSNGPKGGPNYGGGVSGSSFSGLPTDKGRTR